MDDLISKTDVNVQINCWIGSGEYRDRNAIQYLTKRINNIHFRSTKHSRDMKEIAEIIRCDADDALKCKMISNILTAKPHYFEEPKESEKE